MPHTEKIDREEIRRREYILQTSGLGRYGFEQSFDNFEIVPENRVAYESVSGWQMKGCGYYLSGRAGIGKTHLMCALANRCIRDHGMIVRIVKEQDIMEQDNYGMEELMNRDLLILDDLGVLKRDWYYERLLRIVDYRYDNRGLTFATSNLTMKNFEKMIGAYDQHMAEKIVSRLRGLCTEIMIGGSDRRPNHEE